MYKKIIYCYVKVVHRIMAISNHIANMKDIIELEYFNLLYCIIYAHMYSAKSRLIVVS